MASRVRLPHSTVFEVIGLRISLMESWLSGGEPLSHRAFVEEFDQRRNFYFIAHP